MTDHLADGARGAARRIRSSPMGGRFRYTAPAPQAGWIERPRLADRMARRFEVATLLVVAPAGFGKTTLLSQSIAATRDDPSRIDLWLQCVPGDADDDALGRALLDAAGAPIAEHATPDARRIADALGHFAPAEVCLVLDDVHHLAAGSPGIDLLDEFLELLPRNAHLVLAGRTRPQLRLARLQLHGQLEQIGTDELRFDDDELVVVTGDEPTGHEEPVDDTARWPAMAALANGAPDGVTVEYLLQEVAGALGEAHRAVLAALSLVDDVDDEVVGAATDGRATADEVLGNLPLVQRSARGSYRLHDLWRQALVDRQPLSDGAGSALVRIAELRMPSDPIRAAELFAHAGDRRGVARAASTFAARPYLTTSVAELRAIHALARRELGDHPLAELLDASFVATGDEPSSAAAFEAVAHRARAAGDVAAETLALGAALNMWCIVDPDRIPPWLTQRAGELATGGDRHARTISAIARAHTARAAGDPETALAALADMTPLTGDFERVYHAFALSDLGRPEFVGVGDLDDATSEVVTSAGGQYAAQALWLRGDVPAGIALELGRELGAASDEQAVPHIEISTNSVLAFVALAAGDTDAARGFADSAMRATTRTASTLARAFAAYADAACVVVERGEDAARPAIERILTELPVARWPPRPYVYSLPLLYLLAPGTRPIIDRCSFGAALSVAVDAARALVGLRERGELAPCAALPWERPSLLRAHVLPPHLTELAVAAGATGDARIGPLLDELADQRRLLERATETTPPAAQEWARARVALLPARPPYDLRLECLGSTRLLRGDTVVADALWTGRDRVRQLLAHLLLHGTVSRRRVADDLWPGLPADKALANLRVNLTHLQRALQPDREREVAPWFVRADGDTITVAPNGLTTDVTEFELGCRRARAFDDDSRTGRAIETYRAVVGLYRGPYLQEWPGAEWAEAERVRLHTLAVGARCRLGELLLARGEPEQSAAHAAAALRDEPLHERSACLLVHALVAQGDRATARRTIESLVDRLGDHDLAPERSTEQLARRLGLAPAGR